MSNIQFPTDVGNVTEHVTSK